MSSPMDGRPAAETGAEYLRDTQRSIHELGRRVRIPTARQIMGPGLAPWAAELFDWNDEVTRFNGVFYSRPGALNTPDDTKTWIGTNWVTNEGAGVQDIRDPEGGHYLRSFTTAPGATPLFTAWSLESEVEWVTLDHEGTAGLLRFTVKSGWVQVECNITIAIAAGAGAVILDPANAIPAEFCPTQTLEFGGARMSAGDFSGYIQRFNFGSINVVNTSGAATTTVQFAYSYPLE